MISSYSLSGAGTTLKYESAFKRSWFIQIPFDSETIMKTALVVGIVVAGLSHDVAFAQTSDANQGAPKLGSVVQEEMSRKEAHLAAPVRSERDLVWHLTTSSDSPLNLLPSAARWEFIGGLVFTDKGLASYRYEILEEKLTQTGIIEVLSLFGVQHTARMLESKQSQTKEAGLIKTSSPQSFGCPPSPYPGGPSCPDEKEDYYCAPPATCKWQHGSICLVRYCN